MPRAHRILGANEFRGPRGPHGPKEADMVQKSLRPPLPLEGEGEPEPKLGEGTKEHRTPTKDRRIFDPFSAVGWRDRSLCENALTHSSLANERRCRSNECLEFLGDSVLDLLVSVKLMDINPAWSPGELSTARARIVCRSALGERARNLGLGMFIKLGVGADREGLRWQADVLGDALEALLGAAYLDGGLRKAEKLALAMGVLP